MGAWSFQWEVIINCGYMWKITCGAFLFWSGVHVNTATDESTPELCLMESYVVKIRDWPIICDLVQLNPLTAQPNEVDVENIWLKLQGNFLLMYLQF